MEATAEFSTTNVARDPPRLLPRPCPAYVCGTHRTGDEACTNKHGAPAVELTEKVLEKLKHYFLNPAALGALVTKELERRRKAQVLRRPLTDPITVTPAEGGGFTFFGSASFAKFDPETGTMQPVDQALTGQIGRRSQDWCPRGDSNTRHAV